MSAARWSLVVLHAGTYAEVPDLIPRKPHVMDID
jgi:hypothetical protein